MRIPIARSIVAMLLAAGVAGTAAAQSAYPSKPVRIIVPYPAGGVVDTFARVVADNISRRWGQPIIVDSRPGASASIGTMATLQSEPDGYTWLIGGSSLVANPMLFKSAAWNPVKDFAGVGVVAYSPLLFVATNSLPAKNLRELVALAKAKPGAVSAGTMTGSMTQFNFEALRQAYAAQFLMVPYKGAPPVVTDMVNGSVQVSMLPLMTALTQVQAGRIKALAIGSATRSPLCPDVPTFAESGFPDGALVPWYVFVVPRATPAAVVSRINSEINEALKSPEVRDHLLKAGGEIAKPMTPADVDGLIKADYGRFQVLIKRGNITAE